MMMTTWFTFFRGPGRFNDILAIVWHVIVKFLCQGPGESTQSRPGVGTGSDSRLVEAVTAHRCTERAEEEEDIIKMMEENDMHRSPGRESALELGKNCPLLIQFSHNVWSEYWWRLWNENQILYKDNYSLTSSLYPATSIVLSSRYPYNSPSLCKDSRSGGTRQKLSTIHTNWLKLFLSFDFVS